MLVRYKVKLRYKTNIHSSDSFFTEVIRPLKVNKTALTDLSLNRPSFIYNGSKRINLSDDEKNSPNTRLELYNKGIKYYYQNTMDIATRDYIILQNGEEIVLELNNQHILDNTILIWKTCSCKDRAGLYEATFTLVGVE